MTSHPSRSKSAIDRIEIGSFAEACFDQNSLSELEAALARRSADKGDCEAWDITPGEWRSQIRLALAAKRQREENK